jgi:isoaspartyl peptidase/L-asparaginase-like protein (Ntn-hydrolase superfamily)
VVLMLSFLQPPNPPFFFPFQYFIRQNTAATLAHRMQYLHESVHKAARSVVEALRREEGAGGVIALDDQGNGKWLSRLRHLEY